MWRLRIVNVQKANGLSCARIVIDQTSAFAGVCLQQGLTSPLSDEQLAFLFSVFGVKTTVQELTRTLST